jgi:hypothetical protein
MFSYCFPVHCVLMLARARWLICPHDTGTNTENQSPAANPIEKYHEETYCNTLDKCIA